MDAAVGRRKHGLLTAVNQPDSQSALVAVVRSAALFNLVNWSNNGASECFIYFVESFLEQSKSSNFRIGHGLHMSTINRPTRFNPCISMT